MHYDIATTSALVSYATRACSARVVAVRIFAIDAAVIDVSIQVGRLEKTEVGEL